MYLTLFIHLSVTLEKNVLEGECLESPFKKSETMEAGNKVENKIFFFKEMLVPFCGVFPLEMWIKY